MSVYLFRLFNKSIGGRRKNSCNPQGGKRLRKKEETAHSTAEFLTFLAANQEEGVQVVYCDETIWATQAAMGELFGVSPKTINEHLTNIFSDNELQKDRTIRNFQVVQQEGY